MDNEPLSRNSQAILAELTSYHHDRLAEFESSARRRRAVHDRDMPARLHRAVSQMMTPGGLDGAEREFAKETARLTPRGYDPHKLWLPLSALHRGLDVATPGAAGYLVEQMNLPARDILRPWSVVEQGGVTVVEQLSSSNGAMNVCDAEASIEWVPDEGSAPEYPSDPTFTQSAVLKPHTAIGLIEASRQFMLQANPEQWIRRHLLRAAGKIVDEAVLNGSGANGEPRGILGISNVGTQTGTGLDWAGALHMKKLAADSNAQDGTISFIGTTAVRELLEARERGDAYGSGAGFIWQDDRIASCPAFATTTMPEATLLSGPMGHVFFGLWGSGMSIEVNPFDQTLFKVGAMQIRVVVSCDVALGCAPSAFTKATEIS
jgi:hypothetical protein